MSTSPYAVLGIGVSASDDDLKRAFRKALRDTHPDTGGDPQRFAAVQLAWARIGTPEKRAAYDAGRGASQERESFTAQAARPRRDTRPRARSHGHPGGWRRERYLEQLREWVGRGVTINDPYDPVLVRDAPREIQHTLADALAEESTARTLNELGIGYTIWHDVATAVDRPQAGREKVDREKIDHIVLGPTGLFAMLSEDFGGAVRVRKGELIGEVLAGEQPVHTLAHRARVLGRRLRVSFTALVIVLPDGALDASVMSLGKVRGSAVLAITQSSVAAVLRQGIGTDPIGGNELFDTRTRLGAVTFA
jgi:hypothetical protein